MTITFAAPIWRRGGSKDLRVRRRSRTRAAAADVGRLRLLMDVRRYSPALPGQDSAMAKPGRGRATDRSACASANRRCRVPGARLSELTSSCSAAKPIAPRNLHDFPVAIGRGAMSATAAISLRSITSRSPSRTRSMHGLARHARIELDEATVVRVADDNSAQEQAYSRRPRHRGATRLAGPGAEVRR